MTPRVTVLLSLLTIHLPLTAQVFWTEAFQNGCTANCLAQTYTTGPNGPWTVTSTGTNDPEGSVWFISCAENGNAAGACGTGCGSDASLHVSSNPTWAGDLGAAYEIGGWCGVIICVTANLRAESPVINCSGKSNITLCFSYMENGQGAMDDATLKYFDGVTWNPLNSLAKTALTCSPQGLWTAFSIALPASANNNPNIKIGFNWTNNDDGAGADPSFAVDDIILSVLPPVSPVAGLASVCVNALGVSYTVPANNGSTYTWALSGGGTISTGQGTNSITVNWGGTPGSYTVSVNETNCSGTVSHTSLAVTVSSCAGPPVANFGANSTLICEGSCINFSDSSTNTPTFWAWSFPGATPDTSNDQNPDTICYLVPGTYSVTLTATNGNGSDDTIKTSYITVNPPATADAGPNDTICQGSTDTLSGATIGGGASTQSWTTSGTGTYNNATLLNPIYTPSGADVSAGSVKLYITTNDPAGPCPAVTDSMTLTINLAATTFAGPDTIICQTGTYTIAGASIGGSASTLTWSTLGSGTFDNVNLLTATYTPSATDTAAGCVILVITTNDPAGPCTAVTDTLNLCFINCAGPPPVANFAAGSVLICEGSCISFADSSTNTPTSWAWSFPGATPDTSNVKNPAGICYNIPGIYNVSLTAANINGIDDTTMTAYITVDTAAAAATGADDTVCAGSAYTLAGTIGGGASISAWTTSGTGTFNDSSLLVAIYTPSGADITMGSVTLTISTNDPVGPCGPAIDSMVLTINQAATAFAGTDDTVCAGSAYTLAGSIGGGASSSTWSTAGDGVFNDTTLLTATYTPGLSDISAGSVSLTLTTNDPVGPCLVFYDSIILTINPLPVIDSTITTDATSCGSSDGGINIFASGGTSPLQYSINGGSTFSGSGNFTGLSTGSYQIVVSDSNSCSVGGGTAIITAPGAPSVPSAGTDTTYCAGDIMVNMTAAPGFGGIITWYSNQSLTVVIDTGSSLMPDTTTGTKIYYVTETVGACEGPPDSVSITISSLPTSNAGSDTSICEGSSYLLSGSIGGSASGSIWTTSGDGAFNDTTLLTATYTPGLSDISAGSVTLTLTTNDPVGPCSAVSNTMTLTINPLPSIDSSLVVNASTCAASDGSITLFVSVGTGSYTYLWNDPGIQTTSTATGLATGPYIPEVSDSLGCTVTGSPITVSAAGALPPPVAGPDATYCQGSAMNNIFASTSSGGTLIWYSDSGLTNIIGTTDSLAPVANLGTTLYYVTETLGSCESSPDTITIIINASPAAPLAGANNTYCQGDAMVDLSATPGSGGTITWYSNPGLTNVIGTGTTLTPDTTQGSTTYYVTETVSGCQSSASVVVITINICPVPIANFTSTATNICINGCVNFSDVSSNSPTSWLWLFPGAVPSSNTIQNPSNICYTASGIYDVTLIATNANGVDTLVQTNYIAINAFPTIQAGNDTTIMIGEEVTLTASGGISYLWSNGSSGSSIVVSPFQTSTYIVTGADSIGCLSTDTVTVTVLVQNAVYVPNVFSPSSNNQDNRKLYVFGTGIETLELVIYDRWGEKVYETTDATKRLRDDGLCCKYGTGWNGTFMNSGDPINSAVFVYILKVKFINGEEFNEQGNVTLIK